MPKGLGGVDGDVVGIGRGRPLPLPLLDERPPNSGILTLNIWTPPCSRPLLHPTTLPTPLLLTVMGPLPALPLCLSFSKYSIASSRSLAHPPTKMLPDLGTAWFSAILLE